MDNLFKGDAFRNRYRITGTLTTISPLHIGRGEDIEAAYQKGKETNVSTVGAIIRDHRDKPLIPGSTLRGVMRHWLLDVLYGLNPRLASTRDYNDSSLRDAPQKKQIENARLQFSYLEMMFGTPYNAGKLEVWDAVCRPDEINAPANLPNWDSQKLTYIDTSVAIDPATGTARDGFLYRIEVVPPGVEFEVNIVGQNLSDEEIGLSLFALEGFNSNIYPIQLGAHSGRGFGRVHFSITSIQSLDRAALGAWVASSLGNLTSDGGANDLQDAGYFVLDELDADRRAALINEVKRALTASVNG